MGMKSNWKRMASISAIVVIAMITVGCPDSDVIKPNTGQLFLTVEAVGGAGRYDTADLTLSQLQFERVSSTPAVAGEDLGLLTVPTDIELNQAGPVEVQVGIATESRPLNPGTYQLNGLVLSLFEFIDSSGPYCNLAKPIGCGDPDCCVDCLDAALSKLNDQGLTPALSDRLTARTRQVLSAQVDFSVPPTVVLTEGGEATLRLRVDAAGVVDFLASQFTCVEAGICFSNGNLPAPCLNAFPPAIPPAQLEPFFSLQ